MSNLKGLLGRPFLVIALCIAISAVVSNTFEQKLGLKREYDPDFPQNIMENVENGDYSVWTGVVEDMCYKQRFGQKMLRITLKDVTWNNDRLKGGKYIQIYTTENNVKIGQIITVRGKLAYFEKARNEGEFDAYKYYRNIGVMFCVNDAVLVGKDDDYSVIKQKLWEFKYMCEKRIAKLYEEDDASILKAMLLGIKEDLPQDVRDAFQKSGVAHILAISGLHISFICMTLYSLIKGCGKWFSGVISVVFLIGYVVMVGAPVSAVRAGLMFAIMLSARLLKRSYDTLNTLGLAFITIELSNPDYIFNTSLQLSFLAVLAVGFFAKQIIKTLNEEMKRDEESADLQAFPKLFHFLNSKIITPVIVTVMVFLVSLPALLYCYYEVAFYSVFLNLLILPFMPVLLVCAIISIIMTETVNIVAFSFAKITQVILLFYKNSCAYLENTGWGRKNLGKPELWSILLYFIILIFVCLYRGKRHWIIKLTGAVLCVALMTVRIHDGLEICMLDVGQGDCLVLINENANVYIMDCGSTSKKDIGNRVLIPFLKSKGINQVQGIFISHPDEDHINGIYNLIDAMITEHIYIANIYVYEQSLMRGDYKEIMGLNAAINIIPISKGARLKDKDLEITCLYPWEKYSGEMNDNSLVLEIKYGNIKMLDMGDLESSGEEKLLQYCHEDNHSLKCEIVKIGHHGSASSTSDIFLNSIAPRIALISAGKNNRYGHPHVETMVKLDEENVIPFITSSSGEVVIKCKYDAYTISQYINK